MVLSRIVFQILVTHKIFCLSQDFPVSDRSLLKIWLATIKSKETYIY